MSAKILLAGVVLGALVVAVGVGAISTDPSVNADKVCQERFGAEWSGEQVDTNVQNQSVTLECTNGTTTETIGVDISVEVDG